MPHLGRPADHHEIGVHRSRRRAGPGTHAAANQLGGRDWRRIDADFPISQAKLELARSLITDHGTSTRNAARSSVRCGVFMKLPRRTPASEALVPEFRVAVAPCILAAPALVLALSLDLLPDNGIVLCANKRVVPPVGWAKDLQQLGLDGIDVLQPLFQGALVLMPCPHEEPPGLQWNSLDRCQGAPATRNAALQHPISHCRFSF